MKKKALLLLPALFGLFLGGCNSSDEKEESKLSNATTSSSHQLAPNKSSTGSSIYNPFSIPISIPTSNSQVNPTGKPPASNPTSSSGDDHDLDPAYTKVSDSLHGHYCSIHNGFENLEPHEFEPYDDGNPSDSNLVSFNQYHNFSLQINGETVRCTKCLFVSYKEPEEQEITSQKDTLLPLLSNALTDYRHTYEIKGSSSNYGQTYYIDDPEVNCDFLFTESGYIDYDLEKNYRYVKNVLDTVNVNYISNIGGYYLVKTDFFDDWNWGSIKLDILFDSQYRLSNFVKELESGTRYGSEEYVYFTPTNEKLNEVKQVVLENKATFNKSEFSVLKAYQEASLDANKYLFMQKYETDDHYKEDKSTGHFDNNQRYGRHYGDVTHYTDPSKISPHPEYNYASFESCFSEVLTKPKADYFAEDVPVFQGMDQYASAIPDNYVVGGTSHLGSRCVVYRLPDGRIVELRPFYENQTQYSYSRGRYLDIYVDPMRFFGEDIHYEMYTEEGLSTYDIASNGLFQYYGYTLVDGAFYFVRMGTGFFAGYYSEYDTSDRSDHTLTILDEVEIDGVKYPVVNVNCYDFQDIGNKIDTIILGKNIKNLSNFKVNGETLLCPMENSLKTVNTLTGFKSVKLPLNGVTFYNQFETEQERYVRYASDLYNSSTKDQYIFGESTLTISHASELTYVRGLFLSDKVTIQEQDGVSALAKITTLERLGIGIRNTRNLGELFSESSAPGLVQVNQTRWHGINSKESSPRTWYVPEHLSSITLYSGCTIENFAFTGTIPSGYFHNCSFITEIKFASNSFGENEILYNEVFDGTSVTKLDIPSSFSYIYWHAIHELTTLEEITFNGAVDVLNYAIQYCSNLAKINFKGDFAMVRREFFQYCANISEINFELNPNKDYFGRTAHVNGANNDKIHDYDFEDSDIEVSVDLSNPVENATKLKPSGQYRNYYLYSRDKA